VLHIFRVPTITEASKPVDWKPSGVVVMLPPMATTSDPSSSVATTQMGAGLVACNYADARTSAPWVLQFLDHMENVLDDREGNWSDFSNPLHCFTSANLFFWLGTDLTAKLEAANKALAGEKSSQQVED
jgi:hypothetical protein